MFSNVRVKTSAERVRFVPATKSRCASFEVHTNWRFTARFRLPSYPDRSFGKLHATVILAEGRNLCLELLFKTISLSTFLL